MFGRAVAPRFLALRGAQPYEVFPLIRRRDAAKPVAAFCCSSALLEEIGTAWRAFARRSGGMSARASSSTAAWSRRRNAGGPVFERRQSDHPDIRIALAVVKEPRRVGQFGAGKRRSWHAFEKRRVRTSVCALEAKRAHLMDR